MKFRTKYTPRDKVVSPSGTVSLTETQYLKDCDINEIMRRCASGDNSLIKDETKQVFADVSTMGDMLSCMRKITDARDAFETLPSNIRARFGHSPEALLAFLADGKNDGEAVSLGLKVLPKPEKPIEVKVVDGTVNRDGSPENT